MRLSLQFVVLAGVALLKAQVSCFAPQRHTSLPISSQRNMERVPADSVNPSTTANEEPKAATRTDEGTDSLVIPLSFDEMVRQSSTAMKDAYSLGITRQTVRILLPRSADNDQILQYIEDEVKFNMASAVLVPPDETWQGGIMQLYRAASVTCQEILR